MITIGSLCTGYGGLDLAAASVLGGRVLWHAEYDPEASKVLAARWPDVPNLGDITRIKWSRLQRVHVLAAGFPCQDISLAGHGVGIEGGRSGVWKNVAEAVRVLRPCILFVENVAALRQRGLDRVTGDLAGIGYDAEWMCVRASDVGAPHQRKRLFLIAWPTGSEDFGGIGSVPDPKGVGWIKRFPWAGIQQWEKFSGRTSDPLADAHERGGGRPLERWPGGRPEPAHGHGAVADARREALGSTVQAQAQAGPRSPTRWGKYAPAVRRWEQLTRPAPPPLSPNSRGDMRLSPRFVEWMMGLPDGFVCDVPDVSRVAQFRILGNGVVWQQGAAALRQLLHPAY
jgi:DNA (cytosine-5)-methyltransferase 1